MIIVRADTRHATCTSDDAITTGSVGIQVKFMLSGQFNGLSAVAVFRSTGASVDVALMSNTCVVPPEVLRASGAPLYIGVYARNSAGTVVIPTVWTATKDIQPGTRPSGVNPSEPTPDWTAQVQLAAQEAVQTSEQAIENSERAIEISGGAQEEVSDLKSQFDRSCGVWYYKKDYPSSTNTGTRYPYIDIPVSLSPNDIIYVRALDGVNLGSFTTNIQGYLNGSSVGQIYSDSAGLKAGRFLVMTKTVDTIRYNVAFVGQSAATIDCYFVKVDKSTGVGEILSKIYSGEQDISAINADIERLSAASIGDYYYKKTFGTSTTTGNRYPYIDVPIDLAAGDIIYAMALDGQNIGNYTANLQGWLNGSSVNLLEGQSDFLKRGEYIRVKTTYDKLRYNVTFTGQSAGYIDCYLFKVGKETGIGQIFDLIYGAYNYKKYNVLILGDSYSAQQHWVWPLIDVLSGFSKNNVTIKNLGVTNAKIRDTYQDRTAYPYTSRPVSTESTGNLNTIACQIEKLKRLMAGTDLDPSETAIYQNESDYPNVIIIEGGQNDWYDTDQKVETYYSQFLTLKQNVYYVNAAGTTTQGDYYVSSDLETIDRTCFAGAYRYAVQSLHDIFPNAQFFIVTCSRLGYFNMDVNVVRDKVAEQQRTCAKLCGATVIDWNAEGNLSTITDAPTGSGMSADPYKTQNTLDTSDGMHPNVRGGTWYGRLAGFVIKSKFCDIETN